MQKIKCEQSQNGGANTGGLQNQSTTTTTTPSSSAGCLEPARKRQKALNFSIASIMQSSEEDNSESKSTFNNKSSPHLYLAEQQQQQQVRQSQRMPKAGDQRVLSASPSNLSTASDGSSCSKSAANNDSNSKANWINANSVCCWSRGRKRPLGGFRDDNLSPSCSPSDSEDELLVGHQKRQQAIREDAEEANDEELVSSPDDNSSRVSIAPNSPQELEVHSPNSITHQQQQQISSAWQANALAGGWPAGLVGKSAGSGGAEPSANINSKKGGLLGGDAGSWSKSERDRNHSSSAGKRGGNLGANLNNKAGTSSSSSSAANGNGTSSTNNNSRLSQIECTLDNKDMWDKFHSLNTEMIITKTGRRMFPVMKVQFHNLDPNARYAVTMDIVPVDNKRYRYAYHKSCWQVAGKADPSAEPRLYPHPDSPFNGDLLSRQVISFEKVKLTNNEMDKSGHIILNSMHKYQPRVHLLELKLPQTTASHHQTTSKSAFTSLNDHHHLHHHQNNNHNHHSNNNNNNHHQQQQQQQIQPPHLDIEDYKTFVFPETVFTAVTAYQNQLITKMKIDKNPFAKGFRDSSRLSDLDRNDPFDYMGSLGPGGRPFVGQPGAPGSLEAAAQAAGMGAQMDAYQLLASAANNPWYSAVAAATGGGANPFNPMGAAAAACSTAQASQLQAQMWLAAFSAAFSGGGGGGAVGGGASAGGLPGGGGQKSPNSPNS